MDSISNNHSTAYTTTTADQSSNQESETTDAEATDTEATETPTIPKTAKEIVADHIETITKAQSDTVTISPRAEKIQKLNEEFFPSGPSSVQITPDFIERLNEYGLISDADAQKFLGQLDETPSNTTNTLGQISNFIEIFKTELSDIDENHPLLGTLDEANDIVNDMASGKSSYTANEISSVINTLKEFQESEEGQALSKEHQDALTEVQDILMIVQSFNSNTTGNEAAQQYSAIFSQQ